VLEIREISVTHNFQGYFSRTFQDQSDFPGLSRSWNFKKEIQDFPGFSRRRGNPEYMMIAYMHITNAHQSY